LPKRHDPSGIALNSGEKRARAHYGHFSLDPRP
jgi:hypothetical protein